MKNHQHKIELVKYQVVWFVRKMKSLGKFGIENYS